MLPSPSCCYKIDCHLSLPNTLCFHLLRYSDLLLFLFCIELGLVVSVTIGCVHSCNDQSMNRSGDSFENG